MGTRITNLPVTRVMDGDTIAVQYDGKIEKLRLISLDTEESWAGGSKPVTRAGKLASEMAKAYFRAASDGSTDGSTLVDIEFDTDDPIDICLKKHRGNYGRLICYVFKNGENYNLKTVKEGYSPYFIKYGRSRLYNEAFVQAEVEARTNKRIIWDPATNEGGPSRDYDTLLPWWRQRAAIIDVYRKEGRAAGVLSVRMDYEKIEEAADEQKQITVFCDLQNGVDKWVGNGAVIFAGSKFHKFNLWIPDLYSHAGQAIVRLVQERYAKMGRGYVYVSGTVSKFKETPQIVLTEPSQLSDSPS